MTTRSTPFRPEESPRDIANLGTFSITPHGPAQSQTYNGGLNRQKSEPKLHQPGLFDDDGSDVSANRRRYDRPDQYQYQSPSMAANPVMEEAIYDLYGEMRNMLDKMGNLMNVYMSQTRPSGRYTPLPTQSSRSSGQRQRFGDGNVATSGRDSQQHYHHHHHHPQQHQHDDQMGMTRQSMPFNKSQPAPYPNNTRSMNDDGIGDNEHRDHHYNNHHHHHHDIAVDDDDGEGDGDDDTINLTSTGPNSNSNNIHSILHGKGGRKQGMSQHMARFAPDFGDVEDDVVDDETTSATNQSPHIGPQQQHSQQRSQQHSQQQQRPQQQHHSHHHHHHHKDRHDLNNHSDNQLPQQHHHHHHNHHHQQQQQQEQERLTEIQLSFSTTAPHPINGANIGITRSNVDLDHQNSASTVSQNHQRELQLEALYNQSNGLPVDAALPPVQDNDNLSIIDIAFLAHHAKANFRGGATPSTIPLTSTDPTDSNPAQLSTISSLNTSPNSSQHQQHQYQQQSKHPKQHSNNNNTNNTSFESQGSLPRDDGDDFFTMLMRNNSRDPPQLLSDYNVSKNMTTVYPTPSQTLVSDLPTTNVTAPTMTTTATTHPVPAPAPAPTPTIAGREPPNPMQSPTCPEQSPLLLLTPRPNPSPSAAISPSLFQDARRFNPQQNISELEFSRIEPVLANLRLCNPHPHHNLPMNPPRTNSGLVAAVSSRSIDSGSGAATSTTTATTSVNNPDDDGTTTAVARQPVDHDDYEDDHSVGQQQPPCADVGVEASTAPITTTGTANVLPNTILPVATVPSVIAVPSMPSFPSLSPQPVTPEELKTEDNLEQQPSEQQHQPRHHQSHQPQITISSNPHSGENIDLVTTPSIAAAVAPSAAGETLATSVAPQPPPPLPTTTATTTTTTTAAPTTATTSATSSPIPSPQYSPPAAIIIPPAPTPLPKNVSLLPKRRWDRIRIGIDVGGTLAKICYFAPHNPIPSEILLKQRLDSYLIAHHPNHTHVQSPAPPQQTQYQQQQQQPPHHQGTLSARRAQELEIDSDVLHGTLHFVKFQTTSIKHFFDLVNLEGLGRVELFATGGGAHKYRQDFLQMVSTTKNSSIPIDGENNNNNSTDGTDNHTDPTTNLAATCPDRLFHVVDEMSALVRGVAFLIKHSPIAECFSFKRYLFHQELEMYTRTPPAFPFLLVNIGSGVSILRVDNEREYMRVGGSSLGGGTFFGLCRALTGCSSFQEALSLAHRGKGSKVDLLVNDIYGRDYSSLGLSGDTIAASFGKLVKMVDDLPYSQSNNNNNPNNNNPHNIHSHPNHNGHGKYNHGGNESFNPYDYGITREDLAKSALVMITNNICSLAHLYARQVLKVPSVVFVGNFLRNNILAMRMLSYALAYWSNNSIEAIFLKHEGYFGSVGTFFDDENSPDLCP